MIALYRCRDPYNDVTLEVDAYDCGMAAEIAAERWFYTGYPGADIIYVEVQRIDPADDTIRKFIVKVSRQPHFYAEESEQ